MSIRYALYLSVIISIGSLEAKIQKKAALFVEAAQLISALHKNIISCMSSLEAENETLSTKYEAEKKSHKESIASFEASLAQISRMIQKIELAQLEGSQAGRHLQERMSKLLLQVNSSTHAWLDELTSLCATYLQTPHSKSLSEN